MACFAGDVAMAIGLKITRAEESAAELRRMARLCRNVAQARRLLAIASVMDGDSRTEAATAAGMDRQTLRDWVHRFNAEGPVGLVDKPRSGRPARLNEDQLKDLDKVVEAGPDIATDGVVRWRCADLQRVIAEKYKVALGERSVGRILNDRGFRHVSVRPQHPKSDPEAQELFKKASPTS
jgi:transposase